MNGMPRKFARMKNTRDTDKLVFRLYITQQAPSSMRALANLRTICQDYFSNNAEVEVVDTVEQPLRAMQDGIVITPTLVKLAPEPSWSVVGDLSEDARVLASMNADGSVGRKPDVARPSQSYGGKHATVKRRTRTPDSRTDRSTRGSLPPARSTGE